MGTHVAARGMNARATTGVSEANSTLYSMLPGVHAHCAGTLLLGRKGRDVCAVYASTASFTSCAKSGRVKLSARHA